MHNPVRVLDSARPGCRTWFDGTMPARAWPMTHSVPGEARVPAAVIVVGEARRSFLWSWVSSALHVSSATADRCWTARSRSAPGKFVRKRDASASLSLVARFCVDSPAQRRRTSELTVNSLASAATAIARVSERAAMSACKRNFAASVTVLGYPDQLIEIEAIAIAHAPAPPRAGR